NRGIRQNCKNWTNPLEPSNRRCILVAVAKSLGKQNVRCVEELAMFSQYNRVNFTLPSMIHSLQQVVPKLLFGKVLENGPKSFAVPAGTQFNPVPVNARSQLAAEIWIRNVRFWDVNIDDYGLTLPVEIVERGVEFFLSESSDFFGSRERRLVPQIIRKMQNFNVQPFACPASVWSLLPRRLGLVREFVVHCESYDHAKLTAYSCLLGQQS
ncbi:MAG: hypothetical protein AABP62_07280, partial [Planctomycetota bacterium]